MVRLPKYRWFSLRIPVDKTSVLPSPWNSWNTEYRLSKSRNTVRKKSKCRILKNRTTPAHICICFGRYSEGIPALRKTELQTRVMHNWLLQGLLFSIFHVKLFFYLLVQFLMFWNSIGTLTNNSHSPSQIYAKILSRT